MTALPSRKHARKRCCPASSASSASFLIPKYPHYSDRSYDAPFHVALVALEFQSAGETRLAVGNARGA